MIFCASSSELTHKPALCTCYVLQASSFSISGSQRSELMGMELEAWEATSPEAPWESQEDSQAQDWDAWLQLFEKMDAHQEQQQELEKQLQVCRICEYIHGLICMSS